MVVTTLSADDSNLVENKTCKYLIRFPPYASPNDFVQMNMTQGSNINISLFIG